MGGARQFIQKLAGVACVTGGILVPGVLHWAVEPLRMASSEAARKNPAYHISYRLRVVPYFSSGIVERAKRERA